MHPEHRRLELRGQSVKARSRLALLATGLAAAGCGQAELPGTGGLNGVNTLAVVRVAGLDGGAVVDALYGQTAFITSSNSNDLKGLDLIVTDPSQSRNYVPAPNPLQPLSIPTVDYPIELAPSVRYGNINTTQTYFPSGHMDGQLLTGMLLFVRGSASPNISVIGVANVPESLRQLTNGLLVQSAGPVTAISARLTSNEQNVVLYYATFDGQNGTVWERVLQHPPTTSPSFSPPFPTSLTNLFDCSTPPPTLPPTTLYICPPRAVRTYQNASISALQVLPTLPTDLPLPVLGGVEGGRLGVALRDLVPPLSDPSLSNSGEVLIINPAVTADLDAEGTSTDPFFRIVRFFAPFNNPEPPLIPNAAPQPPIRQLMTHPRAYSVVADGGTPVLANGAPPILAFEGARLFGVVDESSCYGSPNCSGILAVDALPFLTDGGVNSNYGLLAFDNSDCLQIAPDGTQYCANIVGTTNRMLALRPGSPPSPLYPPCESCGGGTGIIQGVAIESAVTIPAPTAYNYGLIPLLGVVTVSAESLDHTAAQIFFFDAVGLRSLNETPGPGILYGVDLVTPGGIETVIDGGGGGSIPYVTANIGVGLYPNQTETLTIMNEGEIPGLTNILAIPYDGGVQEDGGPAEILAWPVPDAGAAIALAALEVNDLLFPINLSGTLCTLSGPGGSVVNPYLLVIGVDDAGANIFTAPANDAGIPFDLSSCPGASGYIVVAGNNTALPYIVQGTVSGFLGRMAAGASDGSPPPLFVVPNAVTAARGLTYTRFYNPSVDAGVIVDADAGTVGGVPTLPLTLQLPYQPPGTDFVTNAEAYYGFTISSGFLAASMPIDAIGLGYAGLYLPGGAAQTRVIDVNGEFILDVIAYPSSNTVIDFVPANIELNLPNSAAITVHF